MDEKNEKADQNDKMAGKTAPEKGDIDRDDDGIEEPEKAVERNPGPNEEKDPGRREERSREKDAERKVEKGQRKDDEKGNKREDEKENKREDEKENKKDDEKRNQNDDKKENMKEDEKNNHKDDEEKTDKRPKKGSSGILGLVRDIAVSAAIVAVILASLYAYTGVWPPMVVIESSSMMHGPDSQVGVIDTGDLTLVKSIHDRHDVVTFIEAKNPKSPRSGHQTYGEYGNVIVYRKNGLAETPVIHRAIAWIEFNATASNVQQRIFRGDIPDAGVYNVDTYNVENVLCYGTKHMTVTIQLAAIFSSSATPHNGFVTHGDNNPQYVDQQVLQTATGGRVENIKVEWVVGKAEGELPWFGLFKLWVSGHNPSKFPPSSVQGLVVTIILLVAVPILVDFAFSWRKKNNGNRKEIREKVRRSRFR